MTEKEKMIAGKIYDPSDKELVALRTKAHRLSKDMKEGKAMDAKDQTYDTSGCAHAVKHLW